jgi:hypothetical protein
VTTNDRPATPGAAGREPVPRYEIRVAGRLTPRWSAWFDGLAITSCADGTTAISGEVPDQAALHGLLLKLRDVGLPLVSLTLLPAGPTTAPAAPPTEEGN